MGFAESAKIVIHNHNCLYNSKLQLEMNLGTDNNALMENTHMDVPGLEATHMKDTGMTYLNNLLDFGFELELTTQRQAIRRAAQAAVDPQFRREEAVEDRAYELEIELTVEELLERIDRAGIPGARDRLDDILLALAEHELEEAGK